MVTTVKNTRSASFAVFTQPKFVELVGPAGAGKSSLAHALSQRNHTISIGKEIAFRDLKQMPILLNSIPLVLFSLQSGASHSRPFTWDEIKFLIYLKKWDRVLKKQADTHNGMVLLDHGPIFKMATLHAFGPGWLRFDLAKEWWHDLFQKWSALLDLVVWLDAPDAVLESRINTRKQKHAVQGKTEQEVADFLAHYRSSYRTILSGLTAANRPAVIQFDTSQASIDEILQHILTSCGMEMEIDR